MSEAIYTQRDGLLVPSGHARGPWDPDSQHGGAPAALLARAVEQLEAPGPMLLARLTVEFLGAVPLAPMEVRAEIVRPGRRLQLAEASIVVDGKEVCRARAVAAAARGRHGPRRRDSRAAHHRPGRDRAAFDPADARRPTRGLRSDRHGAALHRRRVRRARAVDGLVPAEPSRSWTARSRRPPSGLPRRRTSATASSSELDLDHHLFVNTDLTFHLSREPEGEWIAVEARTEHGPEGTALARSTLHDLRGPVGVAAQSLYVAPR